MTQWTFHVLYVFLHRGLNKFPIRQFVPNIQQQNNAFIWWTFISKVVFTWIRGTDEQLIVNPQKLVMENDVTLWPHCHQFPHSVSHTGTQCYDPCVSCIANHHGFNGAYCDCNCFTLDAQGIDGGIKSWRIFQYWVWTNGQRWWWTDQPGMIWWRSQKPTVHCRMKKEELFCFSFNNVKLWVCKIYIYFFCVHC